MRVFGCFSVRKDLTVKRFNKKPFYECIKFKSVVNMQISVFLPLCSLQGATDSKIPLSPLPLWQAVPLGLPLPPQHVTLGVSAHWDYRTSLFRTSCNTFKKQQRSGRHDVRSKSSDHMSFFRAHMKNETAQVVKNQHGRAPEAAF